jgi:putative restriction endonuclease
VNRGDLEEYAGRFARLRANRNRYQWPQFPGHRAPHKPLLLLSVIELFEQGALRDNMIEPTPELAETFDRYWWRVLPGERRGRIVLPFFHLRGDGFWHLVPKPGREEVIWENTLGARLDESLYGLLLLQEGRDHLRAVLIREYFTPEMRRSLSELVVVNREAFRYSERLLEAGEALPLNEALPDELYRPAVRDQGFRRAVVTAYDHRCALCGIRIRTLDGYTVVVAAHIKPWSESHDDRPANGIALCQTCHWAFDRGMLRVSGRYEIHASSQLGISGNMAGYLTSIAGRSIVRPAAERYWPDPKSLEWHHRHVFLP